MALRSILQSSGVLDWVVQRVSAVILGVYSIFLLGVLLIHPQIDFSAWQAIFGNPIMKVVSSAALVSLCAHSWIGMWTVTTDYLTPIQLGIYASPVQRFAQGIILTMIAGYFFWGIFILWG
jgi:succinate dehydrogenase / fumarate reductase membrane anchor subunit